MGFMARLLALCSLPRTNPKTRLQCVRRNGPYTLYVTVSAGAKLPFGNLPRLLLAWVCSEAVRTQSRELVLGRSLYEFMRKLGMEDRSGGANAERTRLKNQMRRLFGCTVTLVYEDEERESRVSSLIADRADYWWNAKRPAAPVLWDSTIELGEKFFQEIIAHPVPLDLNILRSLKRSPLGLDPRLQIVHTPCHASWLNQIEIYFSIVQRKVLTPNDSLTSTRPRPVDRHDATRHQPHRSRPTPTAAPIASPLPCRAQPQLTSPRHLLAARTAT